MSPNSVFSNPLGVHPPYGYNHVSITSPSPQIISIAGQLGNDKDGRPLPSYEQQVAQAFKNLQLCLESVGAAPSNVTKIRFYIVDHSDEKIPPLGTSLVKMFGQDPTQYPPSVLVPVPRLATAENFFEIEATAVVERDQATRGGPIKVTNDEFDVLVVGAGLSGLTAAVAVQQAGLSCVVLEAENRVGGKTLSVQAAEGKGVVDLGAAWINDTNQSKMFALAEKYGFHTEVQRVEGLDIAQDEMGKITTTPYGEPKLSKSDMSAVYGLLKGINDEAIKLAEEESFQGTKSAGVDQLTLAEFAASKTDNPYARNIVNRLLYGFSGVEATEMSALHFMKYIYSGTGIANMISDLKDGGQYMRLREGMQSFSERLASELPADSVKLSTPVKSIDQTTKDYMIVKAVDGRTFKAKRVLVSVPTHLYPKITFTPDLPVGKKLLSETTVMGFYAKVILVYDAPWWREAGLSGAMYTEVGPITFTRDTCVPAVKQYSLTCFVVGERGRQWSKLSSAERRKQVLDQFAMLVASVQDVPQPINVIEYEWMKHEWFLGAPSPIMPPGVLTSAAGKSIKTAHDRVHFIGTETSDIWEGYMEGAVRSGERGAKEVIEILAKLL